MKILSVSRLLLISQAVWCGVAVADVDPTRSLENLVFYPHAQESLMNIGYQLSLNQNGSVQNESANQTSFSSTGYNQVNFSYFYGINDKVRLGLTETELIQQTVNSTSISSGVTTTNSSSGPSSPQISVISRTIQNLEAGFFNDVIFSLTPAIFQRQAATSGQSGNNWSAGWITSIESPFYWVFEKDEYEVEPMLIYHFSGSSQGPTLATSSNSNAYWSGALVLSDRYHISERWFAQASFTLSSPYSYTSTNQSTTAATTYNYNFVWNPQILGGYLWSSWVETTLAIAYANTSDSSLQPNGNTNQVTSNQSYATLSLRMKF